MDLIALTTRAHQATGETIAGIGANDWDRSTPCAEWTVRDIVKHLIEGHDSRTAEASGHPMKSRPSADDALAGSYAESSAEFLAAFDAEALEKSFDFGIFGPLPGKNALAVLFVDTLTHHWDLDTALGREHRWDDKLAEAALKVASRYPDVTPVRGPGGAFDHAVEAPPGAGPGARLIALLGRSAQPIPRR
ncbi:TIGR03086 family metal-binding protein [Amycolatopsis sp. EV170708-02-1]|uniref:TIGR03086 family metal-binding protein n=1 Tax=Amycolatopsis sp. EV170708-02-1 TaxID=2919322 RepID=UPI001F0BC095|nr:TIGR03086 family metal-binding protein [Amycolatopsis sp. EV170708-02-1]UMP05935.1 TIGR03086 family metal-binding protein [Amycolatopsis sp. EV170708-02-1]